jgi:hypothetical protein
MLDKTKIGLPITTTAAGTVTLKRIAITINEMVGAI